MATRRESTAHDDPPIRDVRSPPPASAVVGSVLVGPAFAHADGPLTVSTPYPAIETEAGSTVKLDINVATTATEAVDLALGGVPDGWKATLRGGGFVVKAVTATAATPAKAQLEIDVPPQAAAGTYPMTVTGSDGTNTSTVAVHARRRPGGRQRHPDHRRLPVAEGRAGDGVHLQPHRHQQHARAADVHVRSDGSAGLDGDGVAERPGQRPDDHDRCRWQQHRQGRRHAAGRHGRGQVPDRRRRGGGQRGDRARSS